MPGRIRKPGLVSATCGAVILRLRDAKTGPRMVPLTSPVPGVLDGIERVKGVPWVIRSKSNGRLTGLFSQWQRVRKEIGLEDVHDLRHVSCCSKPPLSQQLTFRLVSSACMTSRWN